jgi:hypothetical protein
VDHRGGNRLSNAVAFLQDVFFGDSRVDNDPTAPLAKQARAAEVTNALQLGLFRPNTAYLEDGSFTRWRELSVTYFATSRARLRARDLSVTLAVRNLALWSRYTGLDPEVNNVPSSPGLYGVPTPGANFDIGGDYAALPHPRYWLLTVHLGL